MLIAIISCEKYKGHVQGSMMTFSKTLYARSVYVYFKFSTFLVISSLMFLGDKCLGKMVNNCSKD